MNDFKYLLDEKIKTNMIGLRLSICKFMQTLVLCFTPPFLDKKSVSVSHLICT